MAKAKYLIIIMLAGLVWTISCERRTSVRIEGGNQPTFFLSGSGKLGTVIVYGPDQEKIADNDPTDKTYALWELEPITKGESTAPSVEGLTVTYGVTLPGYKQVIPKTGQAPPLVQGKRYRYWFITINAPGGSGYFEIVSGKAVAVDGP
jgi:hypothetical protein